MTDHAAAQAAGHDRDGRATVAAIEPERPDGNREPTPAPKLLMFGAADAPSCDGDGCVVPFASATNTKGTPE